MTAPLEPAELSALASAHPPRDAFGPGSARPLLAIGLAGSDPALARWLADLPCPVIGLGEGPLAPACDVVLRDRRALDPIVRNILQAPIAAMILVQQLRAADRLDVRSALAAESFAYATAQGGPEFAGWLARRAPAPIRPASPSPVRLDAVGSLLTITLDDPDRRNAIGVAMRDALVEAFGLAGADPAIERVRIEAVGSCFSIGGDVAEFGQVADPARAHLIRSQRLPARALLAVADRTEAYVAGAAIGAGVEIACLAARVTASRRAWFQLPELRFGLIPGAGGTVSLPRRIGRQRTAYLALSMRRISAATALDWGLVDAIVE